MTASRTFSPRSTATAFRGRPRGDRRVFPLREGGGHQQAAQPHRQGWQRRGGPVGAAQLLHGATNAAARGRARARAGAQTGARPEPEPEPELEPEPEPEKPVELDPELVEAHRCAVREGRSERPNGSIEIDELRQFFGSEAASMLNEARLGRGGRADQPRGVARVLQSLPHPRREERRGRHEGRREGARLTLEEIVALGESLNSVAPDVAIAENEARAAAQPETKKKKKKKEYTEAEIEGLEGRIEAAFRRLDVDGSGEVEIDELREFFGEDAQSMLSEPTSPSATARSRSPSGTSSSRSTGRSTAARRGARPSARSRRWRRRSSSTTRWRRTNTEIAALEAAWPATRPRPPRTRRRRSPRAKLTEAQALDASLNPPTTRVGDLTPRRGEPWRAQARARGAPPSAAGRGTHPPSRRRKPDGHRRRRSCCPSAPGSGRVERGADGRLARRGVAGEVDLER